jgi:hypothetical protein
LSIKTSGVCSFKFSNQSEYEITISNYQNLQIGLYYLSEYWDEIIDYKIFDPKLCQQLKHCTVKEGPKIVFQMKDTPFVALNLMPKDSAHLMSSTVEYRSKINNEEIADRWYLKPLCFVLMMLFVLLLYKSVNG